MILNLVLLGSLGCGWSCCFEHRPFWFKQEVPLKKLYRLAVRWLAAVCHQEPPM